MAKKCCENKTCGKKNSKAIETDIGIEMSGTIVISQLINNKVTEVFLTKEDVSKIVEIALFNNVATKKEFE
jgi:hypothetical protein